MIPPQDKSPLITKWGVARVTLKGYYYVGNNPLHRLIFEDFYKIRLPSDIVIHHDDGNKLNNAIWNLIPMRRAEHRNVHKNRRYKKRIISDSIDESKLGYIGHWQGEYGYVYYDDKNHKHKLTSKSLDNLKTECAIRRLSWIENVQMLVF